MWQWAPAPRHTMTWQPPSDGASCLQVLHPCPCIMSYVACPQLKESLHCGSLHDDKLCRTTEQSVLVSHPTVSLVPVGEHTCKEHPDTVGGAMLTGLREAIRVFHMLKGEDAFGKVAAALVDKDAVRKRKKIVHLSCCLSWHKRARLFGGSLKLGFVLPSNPRSMSGSSQAP